jgi:hypothetical protein
MDPTLTSGISAMATNQKAKQRSKPEDHHDAELLDALHASGQGASVPNTLKKVPSNRS